MPFDHLGMRCYASRVAYLAGVIPPRFVPCDQRSYNDEHWDAAVRLAERVGFEPTNTR
jgi:hypothetical protein